MARYIDADKINYTMASVYWETDKEGNDVYRRSAIAFESDIDTMPTADVVEVKQWLGHIQNDNHFPEVTKMVKAIALIEDYIEEPNSIAPDWLEALKLCLRLLREKVDG